MTHEQTLPVMTFSALLYERDVELYAKWYHNRYVDPYYPKALTAAEKDVLWCVATQAREVTTLH